MKPEPARLRGALILVLLPLLIGMACRVIPPVGDQAPVAPRVSPSVLVGAPGTPVTAADQGAALHAQAAPLPQDLTHYHIQVSIDHPQGAFQGRAVVDYINTEGLTLDRLYFRLYPNSGGVYGNGWLTYSGVTLDGSPVETALTVQDTVLEVPLPSPLTSGERVQVALDFEGGVARDFGPADSGYGIYNLTDNVLALAAWYPILAAYDSQRWNLDPVLPIGDPVYSETALYTVDITAAADVVLAATGVEISRLQQNGLTTHRYASGPARDFFIVASPDFQSIQVQVDGTTVNSYYLPGYEAAGERALNVTGESLRIFNQRFGPYPYSELDAVQAPMNNAGGVEYPGIFLVESSLYANPDGTGFLFTVVHETAHQWWYSTVGNDVIEQPWMDEAMATYSSALYFEQVRGTDFYAGIIDQWRGTYERLVAGGRDQAVALPVSHFAGIDGGRDYGAVVYIKGALALHELRQEVGDQAFFQALSDYYRTYLFEIAAASDLLGAFESTSGQELDGFYNRWFFSTSTPPTETPPPTQPPTETPLPTQTFTPQPPTPTAIPPVSFAVIGDYGNDSQEQEDVANLILGWGVDFIITTGDNNYPDGESDTIDDNIGRYFHSYIHPYQGDHGEGAGYIRFFPALGNHDLLTDSGQPYFDYFNLPGNERYYDFVWGPVHLFALNSNDSEPDGVALSSAQAEWLRLELEASTSPWQLVYTHYPPYSSGHHGSTDWMRWPYQEWGADAVISAHDHTYERLLINEFPYFVNGLGGADIYNFDQVVDGSVVRFNGDYGAMLVNASAEQISFQFITRAGEVIDYYLLSHTP